MGHGEEAGEEGCECEDGGRGKGEWAGGPGRRVMEVCKCSLSRSAGRDRENAMVDVEQA